MNKNILLSIILIVISIVVIAFTMTTYRYYRAIHSDDPIDPYIQVEQGNVTISRGKLAIDMTIPDSYEIQEGDIIFTRADSQSVITWPDHSTTRLGPSSQLIIERMRVAADYSRIELVASLESGKVWSNIVRTLYPDSRIEFNIPKYGTVAGVRGTVFEINIDNNYIHSVTHSVTLQNSLGQLVTLLPGDVVAADNIFSKIGFGLDMAWVRLNTTKDTAYIALRDTSMRDAYTLLTGKSDMSNIWDQFVRWILSFFSGFDSISLFSAIASGNISDIANLPTTLVTRWYQSFQSTDFVQERDQLRGVIISLRDNIINGDQIIESLTRGAMWDIVSSSGMTLQYTKQLLDTYAQDTGTTLDQLIGVVKKIDSGSLSEGGRAIYERLVR
ncbi:FecR domain-containing protein [Candidatus Gracilibacteria bacterium]|nr:FecR domain-containing protein [Candidatus Gracilibacteria bacterium]